MKNPFKNNVPSGKLLFSDGALRFLIIPLLIEQLLNVLVGMADTMMVSDAGETAVSGVALVDLVNLLIFTVFAALSTGGAVVVSQLVGAKDLERAKLGARQLMYVAVILGLVLMGIVLAWRGPILNLLFGKTEQAVMDAALIYFFISAFSFPFMALYNAGAAIFRSQGNSRITMYISAIMNLINVVGNAICIYRFHMGAAGVALASTISRIFAAVAVIWLLIRSKQPLKLEKLWQIRLDFPLIRRILAIGIPTGFENSLFQLGRVVLISLVSTFGTVQIAANAVANNLDGFGILPGQAVGLAMVTVIGQCYGAKAYDQSRYYLKKLIKLSYVLFWAVNICILASLPFILQLYNLSDEARHLAFILVWIHNSCACVLWPLAFTMTNALRACNDVRFPMVVSIASMVIFRVGLSYVFAQFGLGVIGVWIAMIIDWICRTIFFMVRTKKILWKY